MRDLICGFAIAFLCCSSVLAQSSGSPLGAASIVKTASAGQPDDRYRIGFQDVVTVQVFRHPELTQTVPVSPQGTIVLFKLDQPVVAVCKTPRELAVDLQNAYKESYLRNPEINVVVTEQRSQPIAVMGAVEKPGSFFATRRYQLLEMLAQAGGPSKEAGTRVIVARTGNSGSCKQDTSAPDDADVSVVSFRLRDIQEGKQTFWMQPGDVVSVLEADIIYVYGNVNKQGAYPVREPITLTQALIKAEGLKGAAKKEKIRVLRQKPGSTEREDITYDLTLIDKNKIKDPILEANDIVAVSEDRTKAILLGVGKALKSSVPGAIYRIP
jgi:polysaccharide biosynthesis/export protein